MMVPTRDMSGGGDEYLIPPKYTAPSGAFLRVSTRLPNHRSRMVKFSDAPFTETRLGSFTPGLLLFSDPGKGANRVPFPAV